nr:hypothetical protein [Paenibacillus alba]
MARVQAPVFGSRGFASGCCLCGAGRSILCVAQQKTARRIRRAVPALSRASGGAKLDAEGARFSPGADGSDLVHDADSRVLIAAR